MAFAERVERESPAKIEFAAVCAAYRTFHNAARAFAAFDNVRSTGSLCGLRQIGFCRAGVAADCPWRLFMVFSN
jgi:hypothetical protein